MKAAVFTISAIFAVFACISQFLLKLAKHVEVDNTSKCPKLFGQSCGFPRFSLSVPLLTSLHWLRFHYRIIYKMCTVTYQALSSIQPAYLNSMHSQTRHSRQLRSINNNPLHVPRVKTKAGNRAFSVAPKTMWNSLLASVKLERNISFIPPASKNLP